MRKSLRCIVVALLALLMAMGLAGCSKSDVPSWLQWLPWLEDEEEPTITCEISFAKEVDSRYQAVELYDTNEFTINTRIYVIVEMTLVNDYATDDYVEFEVQIPYADYYSTHEYSAGVIEPSESRVYQSIDGEIVPMIVLSDMVLYVPANNQFSYTYCFTIEANQVCENAEFIVKFTSQRGYVIQQDTQQKFSETYSFVEG